MANNILIRKYPNRNLAIKELEEIIRAYKTGCSEYRIEDDDDEV